MDLPALTIVPLASADSSLAMFGGKARSLAQLARAGLPVPDGFLVSAGAYRRFVAANNLQESIWQIVANATSAQTASVEQASAEVKSLFETARLPNEIAESITHAVLASRSREGDRSVLVDFGIAIEIFLERPFFLTVNGYAYCRGSYRFSWRLLWALPRILYAYLKVVPGLLKNLKTRWRDEALPAYLETIDEWNSIDLETASDQHLLSGVRELAIADANYWFSVFHDGSRSKSDGRIAESLSAILAGSRKNDQRHVPSGLSIKDHSGPG